MSSTPATTVRGAEFSHYRLRAWHPGNDLVASALLARGGSIDENVLDTGGR